MEKIVIEINRDTAQDIYNTYWDIGEHISAGGPIGKPTERESVFFRRLQVLLGEKTLAESYPQNQDETVKKKIKKWYEIF